MPGKPRSDKEPTTVRIAKAHRDLLVREAGDEGKLASFISNEVVPQWLDLRRSREGRSRPEIANVLRVTTDRIMAYLRKSPEWISEALQDVQWYQDAESVFGERVHHFEDEKVFLSSRFVPLLVRRILRILKTRRKVFLVIDSGTTTFWLFRKLAGELLMLGADEAILRDLVIVTNNIAGVVSYMSAGKLKPKGEPEKKLSGFVECKVLPGRVLADYAALTGPETEGALKALRGANPDACFIGLVVGNWIWLPRGDEMGGTGWDPAHYYPVPLARDHELHRHLEFKQELISGSDEIYVCTPLAKVFIKSSLLAINQAFLQGSAAAHEYHQVPIDAAKRNALKLVSTVRLSPENDLLYAHSSKLVTAYSQENSELLRYFVEKDIPQVPSLLFGFDGLTDKSKEEQKKIEFPHDYTQAPKFMADFFGAAV